MNPLTTCPECDSAPSDDEFGGFCSFLCLYRWHDRMEDMERHYEAMSDHMDAAL